MVIVKVIDKPVKTNCVFYNTLRLIRDNTSNDISVYPCCYATDKAHLIKVLPYDYIVKNIDNIFEILVNIYKESAEVTLNKFCKRFISTSAQNCQFNNAPLKTVDLSFLHNCNLDCTMCTIPKNDNAELVDLYFNIMKNLVNHNISISTTQQGEPFFYKAQFFEFLNTLSVGSLHHISIVSNLTMLNTDDIDFIAKISRDKNIKFYFIASIDGITAETYKKIRKNNQFEKVMHNALLLKKYDMLNMINYVAQDVNIHELADAYAYWQIEQNVNFNAIAVSDCYDPEHYNRIYNSSEYQTYLKIHG